MKKAVQQIMIGSIAKNPDEAESIMKKIKSFGYDSIELNGFMIRPTPWVVRLLTKAAGMPVGKSGNFDWAELIRRTGLSVTGIHEALSMIKSDPDTVIHEAKKYNTEFVIVTGMYRFDYSDYSSVQALAQELNNSGEKLKQEGIRLLYHNHNVEFQKVLGDKNAFDVLIEETDSRWVNFEFDSYWPAEAGVDILTYMKKLNDRMKLYHINDRGSRKKEMYMTPILKSNSMELGYGNMNLTKFVDYAKNIKVDSIILETHKNWVDHSPLKSIELSSKFLNKHV